jgi:hypothetical protein
MPAILATLAAMSRDRYGSGVAIDYGEVERELRRIPDISAARIVTNDEGRPVEVHILAAPTKLAKQVVRDVQSVAMAAFGVELDRRVISVVQLEGSNLRHVRAPGMETNSTDTASISGEVDEPSGLPAPRREPPRHKAVRLVAGDVHTIRRGQRCEVEVTLGREGRQASGSVEGLYSESALLRLVARATVAALIQLEPDADRLDVDSVALLRAGDHHVVLTTVVLVDGPSEEVLTGSAVIRVAGPLDAMARAVLDAINRRLSRPG